MVDFDEPGLKFIVDEYVEAEDLEAEWVYSLAVWVVRGFLLEEALDAMPQAG